MPRKLSITALQAIILPHARRFSRAVWPVWEDYIGRVPEEMRLKFDLKTEANVLHRLMVANVKREFDGVPGIYLVEENGFFVGIDGLSCGIDGQAACRLKKLNDGGHSRNYPTERALRIRRNETETLDLGLADSTVVDVGYVLNALRTGFGDVQAVRVVDEAFVMNFPRDKNRTITMPQPIHGSNTERSAGKRFTISPRKQKSSKPTGQEPGQEL